MNAAGDPGRRPRVLTHARRTIIAATLSSALGVLPVFLLGAFAVLVREDLGFSETQLGAAVGLFSVTSMLTSTPAGRLVERIGAGAGMRIVALGSAASLLGIAGLARSYGQLLAFMAVAGLSMALAQPASNLAIAGAVAPARHGLAFGLKQSAVPLATLAGGVTLPVIGLTVGWRWAYAVLAVGAGAFLLIAPRTPARARPRPPRGQATKPGGRGLVVLALGTGFGIAAANSMGTFYVESAVSYGMAAGVAGAWYAFGSVSCIAARVWWGWRADRRAGGHLPRVAALMAAGGVAVAGLAQAGVLPVFAVATAVAFAAGWGWMGLFQLSVVRIHHQAPAAATGITQTGAFGGAVIGPPVFGALAEHVSFAVAWLAAGVCLGAAAILVLVGRAIVLRDRSRSSH